MDPIYLDHNATTPLLPQVAAAMAECQAICFANPESQHQFGRRARQLLDDAREGIARLLGANLDGPSPDRLIFTSGGTEANNLAVLGLSSHLNDARPGAIVISAIEHPSVRGPAEHLSRHGWQVDRLAVSPDGTVCLDDAAQLLAAKPRLASLMLGNNETGVLQPVARLAELAAAAGVPLHTDAVQVVGKLPVDFRRLGVAALTAAAHKFHGPRGIGALLVRGDVALGPILFGGFQQQGLRPGTESVALAVGMYTALQCFAAQQAERRRQFTELRDRLESGLRGIWPDLVIHGAAVERLPQTICVSLVGLDRQTLLLALDMAGVACSIGSACASGSSEPAATLIAMGLAEPLVRSSLRFSLGATTSLSDVDRALERIAQVCRRLGAEGRRSIPHN